MKKILALILVSLLVLTGCGKDKPEEVAEGKSYHIGTAVLTTEKQADAADEDGSFEVNTYYGTVVLDGDKIVNLFIDAAQNKLFFNKNDELTKFEGKGTKRDLGDNYNMVKFGGAVAEWYKQMDSFQEYAKGKTVQQVLEMPTYEKDANHPAVPDVEDLKSSVTIDVSSYLKLLEMAADNAVKVDDVVKVATSSNTSAKEDSVEIGTTVASVAVNSKGEIVYVYVDDAQNKGKLSGGVLASENLVKSKRQLGDDYNMVKYGGASAEWYEQIDSLQAFLKGKTAKDITEFKFNEGKLDNVDVNSTVTIATQGHVGVVSKALEKLANVE